MNIKCAEIGSTISTWSYPLHADIGDNLQLQPDFYNSTLQDIFTTTGPSAKLRPPILSYEHSSLWRIKRRACVRCRWARFGIASCSYDGDENIAFVTPVSAILEIELQKTTYHSDDGGSRSINTVNELATMGALSLRSKL